MPIINDLQLQQVLLNDLNTMIDEVAGKLLANLQDYIQTEVYDKGFPTRYERQGMDGGIQGSFETSTAVTMGNKSVEAWIEHDPMSMTLDREEAIHGGILQVPDDVRSILADIIIGGFEGGMDSGQYDSRAYSSGDLGFWTKPRDFWSPFMKELNKNGDKFIEAAFKKRGIVWHRASNYN